MNVDSLKQIRNVLLRTALISLLLTWLLAAITIGFWDTWSGMTSQWFHTPAAELGPMVCVWFALVKFYFIFVLLAPALGLDWEIRKITTSRN